MEHSRVQSVVALEILADIDDAVSIEPDLGSVVDVEHAINIAIHSETDLSFPQRVTQEDLSIRGIEHVVGHHQQERFVNQRLSSQGRDPVALMVVRILHPVDLDTRKRMGFVPLLNHVAAISEDDDKPVDPRRVGTTHDVLKEWLAVELHQWFGKFSRASCQATAVAGSENQSNFSVGHI